MTLPTSHVTIMYLDRDHKTTLDAVNPAKTVDLDKGWEWKQRNPSLAYARDEVALPSVPSGTDPVSGWHRASAFPSEIHVELLNEKLIPDPFIEFNEHKVQWVGLEEWLYKTTFPFEGGADGEHTELVFEGLDTFADVYLNGESILAADNQFRTWIVSLTFDQLKAENVLLLHFKSASKIAKELEAKYGRVRAGSTNLGDPSRVYVRKAQYDWRWDWGPELMTVGPYRAIRLRTYRTRIVSQYARINITPQPSQALDMTLSGNTEGIHHARITLKDGAGVAIRTEGVAVSLASPDANGESETRGVVEWTFGADEVALWWPVGYGAQALYDLEVILMDEGGTVLDTSTQRIGFRSVQLIQEPLEHADQYGKGTTFLFEVNGVRIFVGGSNWVPCDNFLTRVTSDKLRAWLTLLRDGNQNMVRLWGGGVYEPDAFYDACDELGLLVWQDFQFACGIYPAHAEFVESVRREAEDNVRRLRHHPSFALFCGNNEDYQQILQWDVHTDLPARVLYENVLPGVVACLTAPPIPYHRGSPYGGKDWDTSDPTVGDVHQWDVWGGKERPWQEYDTRGGRFVSEFGMPGFPDMRTVKCWMGALWDDEKERHAQAPIMAQHTRAGMHERRFAVVMNENFRLTGDLETHVFRTQINQSEAVSYAYRIWRREWRGPGKQFCSGVLVWQSNDCWAVTSWAIADYFLRPKPIFYTIARELKPITVGIFRTVTKNRDNDRPKQYYEFGAYQTTDATVAIWGTNGTLEPRSLTLEVTAHSLQSDWRETTTHAVTLVANQSTELLQTRVPTPGGAADPTTASYAVVVAARLLDGQGSVVARFADWSQPYKALDLPDPGLAVHIDGERVRVEVRRPVKGLVFTLEGTEDPSWSNAARFSDNALDVVPGDPQVVTCPGLGGAGKKLKAAWLGRETAQVVA